MQLPERCINCEYPTDGLDPESPVCPECGEDPRVVASRFSLSSFHMLLIVLPLVMVLVSLGLTRLKQLRPTTTQGWQLHVGASAGILVVMLVCGWFSRRVPCRAVLGTMVFTLMGVGGFLPVFFSAAPDFIPPFLLAIFLVLAIIGYWWAGIALFMRHLAAKDRQH